MPRDLLSGVIACALVACAGAPPSSPPRPPSTGGSSQAGPAAPLSDTSPYPPAVLMGDVELHCTISARERGRQTLVARAGTALEFDAVVSPIMDGEVQTRGESKGGTYKFSSHLASPASGKLGTIGDVKIDELETRVTVEMTRYSQPKGAGTPLRFTSADMRSGGIYVEFMGKATATNGDRYAFRVNLGAPREGSGEVAPEGPGPSVPIQSKMVVFQAPTITVVSKLTVQRLP